MGIHACPLRNEADVLKENLIESFQIYVDIDGCCFAFYHQSMVHLQWE